MCSGLRYHTLSITGRGRANKSKSQCNFHSIDYELILVKLLLET